MNLNTFSAQTINFVDDVMEFDYQELINNVLVIGAICAVILGAMYTNCVRLNSPHPTRLQIGSIWAWIFVRRYQKPWVTKGLVSPLIVTISVCMETPHNGANLMRMVASDSL